MTEHPIETGRSTSDHAQARPLTFTLSGLITESPFQGERAPVERGRVQRAREFLAACEEQPLTVGTPRSGIYQGAFLLGYPHEVTKRSSVTFEMSFRVVEFQGQETVLLPAPKPKAQAGAPKKVDVGEQPKKEVEPGAGSKEEEELKSLLASGRDSEVGDKLADTKFAQALGLDTLTAPTQ